MRRLLLAAIVVLLSALPTASAAPPPRPDFPGVLGKDVEIRFESTPPGAAVYDGDRYSVGRQEGFLGQTPFRCLLKDNKSYNLWYVLAGYASQQARLNPINGEHNLQVALEPTTLGSRIDYLFRYQPLTAWPVLGVLAGGMGAAAWAARRRFRGLHQQLVHAELEGGSLLGRAIGDYRVERPLGEGAFSHVYLVEHTTYGDRFAMKILKKEFLEKDFLTRFHREMEVGRDMQHPNLVRVFGFGDFRDAPYLVMELLSGRTLEARLREGRLELGEALRLFLQICHGLAHAHKHGVVHRDVKPENVMLEPDGTVRIMDFGIAKFLDREKITATDAALGTPRYMSPDHLRNKSLDARSDIYSMGVILYELLSGEVPFKGDDTMAVISGHLSRRPPSLRAIAPDVPPELDGVVMKMLEKKPERRFPNMDAVIEAVQPCALYTR